MPNKERTLRYLKILIILAGVISISSLVFLWSGTVSHSIISFEFATCSNNLSPEELAECKAELKAAREREQEKERIADQRDFLKTMAIIIGIGISGLALLVSAIGLWHTLHK